MTHPRGFQSQRDAVRAIREIPNATDAIQVFSHYMVCVPPHTLIDANGTKWQAVTDGLRIRLEQVT